MASYVYKGRNSQGELVFGKLEGGSAEDVAKHLYNSGVTPITVEEQTEFENRSVQPSRLSKLDEFLAPRVSLQDLILFCRQMYSLSKAGVPITKGMRSLASSIKHVTLKQAITDVANSLETGMDLTAALKRHPNIFNQLFVNMIHVGENSGQLDMAFHQLSTYLERDDDTSKRIKTATRYPTFVMIAMVIAMFIINIKVIPAIAGMFQGFGAQLPWATRVLLGVSNFFVHYWSAMVILGILGFYSLRTYMKTDEGRVVWGKAKLRMPIVGDIVNRSTMARYARALSLMMSSGVPLMQSLDLCAQAVDNPYLGQKILKIREGIQRGETLLQTHTVSNMFTPLILQMISVGEESGKVDVLLKEMAEFYEREVDFDLKSLSDRIEPILIVIMAGMVAVLALGIFLPMWDMLSMHK